MSQATIDDAEGREVASTGEVVAGGGGSVPVTSLGGEVPVDVEARCFPAGVEGIALMQSSIELVPGFSSPSSRATGYQSREDRRRS